jgi:transcription elongation factor Elf1
MDNMNPMQEKKDTTFDCPNCGMKMSVESKDEADSEHVNMKPKPKMNTGNMPMSSLRSKITPPSPNLNSY